MSLTEQRFAIADGKATLFFLGHDLNEGAWQVWLDQKLDFDGIRIGYGADREAAIASAVDILLEGVRALRALSANGDISTEVIHREP